jgi:hypothetical protein
MSWYDYVLDYYKHTTLRVLYTCSSSDVLGSCHNALSKLEAGNWEVGVSLLSAR